MFIDWVEFVKERQDIINVLYVDEAEIGKCYDVTEYAFVLVDDDDTRFHFSSATALIFVGDLDNCGVWVHEFTEMVLIQILHDWGLPWRNDVKFGRSKRRIPHVIASIIESGIRW
jgi:hypothetical protein